MSEWKKVVLVIKKEDLISEIPCSSDFYRAWGSYVHESGLNPYDIDLLYELKSKRKEFKRTWHITIKFRKRREGEVWRYEG